MLHPATAHFAIVLPIVALVFGLIYMYTKTEGMSKISSRLYLVAAIAMAAAWYTGSQAGPEVFDYLSEKGQHTLKEHKEFGLYLAVAMGLIALLKIAGCRLKKAVLETVSTLLLIGVVAFTLFQGKIGGEVTYNHGMPFKAFMMEESLDEAVATAQEEESDEEKVTIYEDAIDEIKEFSSELNELYGKPIEDHE